MRRLPSLALLFVLVPLAARAQTALTLEPVTFAAADGRTVQAETGRFQVPENRARPGGRTIGLAFVRFPSTNPTPGPPIVYLAGGPGGAGTDAAKGARYDLFQALRAVADVIAFDQRGTGLSDRLPDCPLQTILPMDVPGSRAAYAAAYTETARACAAHWRGLGVDLAAYTTEESADDLDALRQALGVDRISLWAISYGTHLALSAIRRHPDAIARAVLAGVEGPDHTLKLPSDQQALLERIAGLYAIEHPDASPFLADVEAVLGALRETPAVVTVGGQTVALGAFDVQWLAANMLVGPEYSMALPPLFAAMRAGDFSTAAAWTMRLKAPSSPSAMASAMDAASGASPLRRERIAREARTTLLADAIDFPAPEEAAALGVPDLGDAFRAPVTSSVPVLFISGTLDGRTPAANADEVAAGFSRGTRLVIEGAGHSDPLFLGSPRILDRMRTFFAGGAVGDETLSVADAPAPVETAPIAVAPVASERSASGPPLVPGDARLDVAAVTVPSSRTFRLTVVQGTQRMPFGTMTETLARTADGGVVRVQRIDSPRGAQLDSLTASSDLAPRSHVSRNPGRSVALQFTPRAVTGTYTDAGAAPVAIDDARGAPAFDSGMIDLVARAVPLDVGFEATAQAYERPSAGASETGVVYTLRVIRHEVLDGREAFVVEFFNVGDGPTRVWIAPASRELLRLESPVAPGVVVLIEPS